MNSKYTRIIRDYANSEQFNQIDNYNAQNYNYKNNFINEIFYKASCFKSFFNSLSFYDEFYLVSLNENSLKANRAYIYCDNGKYTIDFISEWKDTKSKKIFRNIKKTIENVNISDLRVILRNLR